MNKITLQHTLPEVFAGKDYIDSDVWHKDVEFERFQLLSGFTRDLTLQRHAALASVRGLFLDVGRFHIQYRRKKRRENLRVFHLSRACAHGVCRCALCQNRSVPIYDHPPRGSDDALGRPLCLRAPLQILRRDALQIEQPRAQRHKQPEKDGHT